MREPTIERKEYVTPAIILELDMETRAGSPLPCPTPLFPLPQSELDKCK